MRKRAAATKQRRRKARRDGKFHKHKQQDQLDRERCATTRGGHPRVRKQAGGVAARAPGGRFDRASWRRRSERLRRPQTPPIGSTTAIVISFPEGSTRFCSHGDLQRMLRPLAWRTTERALQCRRQRSRARRCCSRSCTARRRAAHPSSSARRGGRRAQRAAQRAVPRAERAQRAQRGRAPRERRGTAGASMTQKRSVREKRTEPDTRQKESASGRDGAPSPGVARASERRD
jgi:hypothetical protein